MSKRQELNERQEKFIQNYISNGANAKKAAIEAGYSPTVASIRASSFLDHPIIKARIDKAYTRLDRQKMKDICLALEERVRLLSKIIYDVIPNEGEPIRKHYPDAIRAIQELNKLAGDYAPDRRLSVTVDATKDRLEEAKRVYEEY
jgi:hypothetical protein